MRQGTWPLLLDGAGAIRSSHTGRTLTLGLSPACIKNWVVTNELIYPRLTGIENRLVVAEGGDGG